MDPADSVEKNLPLDSRPSSIEAGSNESSGAFCFWELIQVDPGGYVKIQRKIINSAVWGDEALLKVFLWCIMRANYHHKTVSFGGEQIKLDVGQFVTGRFSAAKELDMAGSTVADRLRKLERWGMLTLISDTRKTVVTVCNYKAYQLKENQARQRPVNDPSTVRHR